MKGLFLNGYYMLPDNFKGDFPDALESLASYLRTAKITTEKGSDKEEQMFNKTQEIIYTQFVDAILNRNKSFKGIQTLFLTDDKGNVIEECNKFME